MGDRQAVAVVAAESVGVKSQDILDALRALHPAEQWAFFRELRIGTGYGKDSDQRLDAWAIHFFPSEHCKRVAYEVKVSRSDFRREVRAPLKRRWALLLSNEFYFAAPAGLIKPDELPPEAGLVELDAPDGRVRRVVAAPWRDTPPPTYRFLAGICRRAPEHEVQEREDLRTRNLQSAVLTLARALNDCLLNDRSQPYEPREPRPSDAKLPGFHAWRTPGQIARDAFESASVGTLLRQLGFKPGSDGRS